MARSFCSCRAYLKHGWRIRTLIRIKLDELRRISRSCGSYCESCDGNIRDGGWFYYLDNLVSGRASGPGPPRSPPKTIYRIPRRFVWQAYDSGEIDYPIVSCGVL